MNYDILWKLFVQTVDIKDYNLIQVFDGWIRAFKK